MGIQEKISQKYKELISHKFDNKPKYQAIIEYIIINEPNLMDDDRIFCFLFDKIAVNNGLNECELPSYWTMDCIHIPSVIWEHSTTTSPPSVWLA